MKLTFSTTFPMPVVVRARPPKTCVASGKILEYKDPRRGSDEGESPSAVCLPALEMNLRAKTRND